MRNSEGMARRIYPIDDMIRIAMEMACITKGQLASSLRDPSWSYMAKAAVIGVVYELCETSQPELSRLLGINRTTILSQIKRFQEGWPQTIRRSWIEAVICRFLGDSVHQKYPEIKHGVE